MSAKVNGHYPLNPTAAFYAEAPGTEEVKHNEPLTPAGQSGFIFNRLLNVTGLSRRRVVIDNFYQYKLPSNDESSLYKVSPSGKAKVCDNWDELTEDYKQRISNCGTNLIFLMGASAVVPIFGFEYAKISQYRGYPMEWADKLIIPTYHPAVALIYRQPQHYYTIYADILKGLRIQRKGRQVSKIIGYQPDEKGWRGLDL